MQQRGLSGADVARAANIGEADISRIVSRNMEPTAAQAVRLLEVLDPPTCVSAPIEAQVSADA